MKKYLIVLTLWGALTGSVMVAAVKAQEQKHEEHQAGKTVPNKNAAEPVKADGMKCCEGMEKIGEMKAGLPMKGEMTDDMKAKMEKMKEKMAEKMGAKGMKVQTKESKVEKTPSSKDDHQH